MADNKTLKIVFGAMTFGKLETLGARVHDLPTAADILDTFQRHNHHEIDTARLYGNGSSEEMLASLNWQARGLTTATKIYPNAGGIAASEDSYTHQPADLRRGLTNSLRALNTASVDLFYLHGPDRNTPFEDTLREVNALHAEGRFARFGLSNFMAWEVAQICEICRRHGWIAPTVYQGVYHVLQRSVEAELLSCLRAYGIALYAFQPLAGGLLTGRYVRGQTEFEAGSRFDGGTVQGRVHRGRYWNEKYFDALEMIHEVAGKFGLGDGEVALRWLKYHSKLREERGDAIVVGASSVKHLEDNLADLEKGPLPEEVVEVLDEAWGCVRGVVPNYWH
ncbi:aldo/keto reductase family protein [Aspergillus clavatus NRRL 1]|uniref:Aldo/keto reductase n=1 Tax=Aspergillus clavatus (strain ATCC 1007 / CBS 513.65 / DSM 816 / NCTC 3887 / NRRL 1 / QM 1276 / 107) TaxID=344612 RepID=A1C5J1_ASPCL|nr:aldo/keto reductase [Aspergillus clavatus NRRL 1]EAW14959.1 aldo/keto reductase [Aspergillus clavatus NRRL 1]